MCEAYASHIIEASKAPTVEILPREVEEAFWIAWPNIVCHIEDKTSSESDKKVEWYVKVIIIWGVAPVKGPAKGLGAQLGNLNLPQKEI